MDLGFARRRRKAVADVGTPMLEVLLSSASARQSGSATARAQAELEDRVIRTAAADSHIDLFAPRPGATSPVAHDASFSALPPFTPCQPN